MKLYLHTCLVFLLLALPFSPARADEYGDTIKVFRDAGESGTFFAKSYGYAVFPTIGKGGIGIGGAIAPAMPLSLPPSTRKTVYSPVGMGAVCELQPKTAS